MSRNKFLKKQQQLRATKENFGQEMPKFDIETIKLHMLAAGMAEPKDLCRKDLNDKAPLRNFIVKTKNLFWEMSMKQIEMNRAVKNF